MTPNTTDTAHEKASTDAPPSGRARRRRLITALTVLAVIAIIAIGLYAISLIEGAVIILIFSALLASHILWQSPLPISWWQVPWLWACIS